MCRHCDTARTRLAQGRCGTAVGRDIARLTLERCQRREAYNRAREGAGRSGGIPPVHRESRLVAWLAGLAFLSLLCALAMLAEAVS